jgi:CDP-diacylglycerol--serine O-phosphatidyltransferase
MKLFTIPNFITSLHALCGCLSVAFASMGQLEAAFGFILGAAVCDFLDGFTARLLRSYSDVGKQLDSLADVVSFGLAPAFMLFMAMQQSGVCGVGAICAVNASACPWQQVALFFPFLLTIFSALRLAKFNVDERQTTSFLGLPTPACGLFFAALSLNVAAIPNELEASHTAWYILALVVIFCYLLICEIPMFSFKMKGLSIKKYWVQYIFWVITLILLLLYRIDAVVFSVLLYIILSVTVAIIDKLTINQKKS